MQELKLLEYVSVAFNHLSAGKAQKVLETFEKVNPLPLAKDGWEKSFDRFLKSSTKLKMLLINILTAAAKCIYMEARQQIDSDVKRYNAFERPPNKIVSWRVE